MYCTCIVADALDLRDTRRQSARRPDATTAERQRDADIMMFVGASRLCTALLLALLLDSCLLASCFMHYCGWLGWLPLSLARSLALARERLKSRVRVPLSGGSDRFFLENGHMSHHRRRLLVPPAASPASFRTRPRDQRQWPTTRCGARSVNGRFKLAKFLTFSSSSPALSLAFRYR